MGLRSCTHNRDRILCGRPHVDHRLVSVDLDVADGSMAQVVGTDGVVMAASINLGDARPISRVELTEEPRLLVLRGVPDDADRETYRVWARTALTTLGPVRIFVGTSPEQTAEAVRTLQSGLLIGVPGVMAILAAGVWALTGRALRPVEEMRADVMEITANALDRRVPVPETGDEIEGLATTMNAMLERLADGTRRQREFVADASHELQSPLAAIRVQLEVAVEHPDATDWPELARDLLADSDRLERLVRDLLFLAREDSGEPSGDPVPVDLDTIVLEEVARLLPRPGVTLDASEVGVVPVLGRTDDLSRMVRNVLENAVDHARSRVRVILRIEGGAARLDIGDDGPGVPEELREAVFERFVRIESDRARGVAGGTGL
jgi:signal transduction histidine kinase